jgi:hypothetical protein
MKKQILIVLAFAMLAVVMVGCSIPKINTTGKAVLIDGYSAVNLIDSGYNPATGTITPSITSIISSGMYSGVPVGNGCKDYLHYSSKASSSIWNASASTYQSVLIFSSGDKALMQKVLESLKEKIKQDAELKETAPDGDVKN